MGGRQRQPLLGVIVEKTDDTDFRLLTEISEAEYAGRR
jgi:hypothetical protein